MIDSTTLNTKISRYIEQCKIRHCKPTFKGIGNALSISGQTVSNVVHGTFNGKRYTERPHSTRIIANSDFEILQGLFDSEGTNYE